MNTVLKPTEAEAIDPCKKQLRDQVQHIADELTNGLDQTDAKEYAEDGEEFTAWDYIRDVLDINWILHNDRTYKGARLLVAYGGPNIWIDTVNEKVQGYWWGDYAEASFSDNIGLDDVLQELFNC